MQRPVELLIQGTPALARFRSVAGINNFYLNTALVGVETLLVNEPIYPIELAVQWAKPSKLIVYDNSKQFLLKGMAALLVDAIDQYMRNLMDTPSLLSAAILPWLTGTELIIDSRTGRRRRATISERLSELAKFANVTEQHWIDTASLLVYWRNQCVHGNYRFRMDPTVLSSLEAHSGYFFTEHRSADIGAIVAAYKDGKIFSNTQLATLTSVTHRLISKIDVNILGSPVGPFIKECVLHLLRNMPGEHQVWVNNTWKRAADDRVLRFRGLLRLARVATNNKSFSAASFDNKELYGLATMSRADFLAIL
jgi:hypothetical protein